MPRAILIPHDNEQPVRALHVVEADGMDAAQCCAQLLQLQELVGGHIEMVTLSDTLHGYINEDGKALDLPVNDRATKLAYDWMIGLVQGDVIVGNMVILSDDGEGNETDVPSRMADELMEVERWED